MWELPAKDLKAIIIKMSQPLVINSLGKTKK